MVKRSCLIDQRLNAFILPLGEGRLPLGFFKPPGTPNRRLKPPVEPAFILFSALPILRIQGCGEEKWLCISPLASRQHKA